MSTNHRIVGTAGHIDHGKSALVKALTGTDPDRLKEEKTRGITIELGFADLELEPGQVLSFVDVPGHERFVRHMVAGAAGIDAVLLVVAADDGVRPQTREHLEICSLLEIRHGLVALTKCDLVDEELREVVAMEISEFLKGSFLEGAPVVSVSSRTGEGLDGLRSALGGLWTKVPERPEGGVARLPVDRSFVLRGFGTVVTGTLASGSLGVGEEVEVLPGGRRGRIRGLQVHHRKVSGARAGQRTAVNLQGLDREQVPRGSTVVAPGTLLTTRRIWAGIRLLSSAPDVLRKGGPVRFHQGTCDRAARIRMLRDEEEEGGFVTAEIRFDEPTVLLPGDRFILRRPAPMDTVGGGIVQDVRPPEGRTVSVPVFEGGAADFTEGLLVRVSRAGGRGRVEAEMALELGLAAEEMSRKIDTLAAEGRLVRAAGLLFEESVWRGLEKEVERVLGHFHLEEPLRQGMSREELRGRVCREMLQEAWRERLEQMAREKSLRLEGERVALASHRVILSPEDKRMADRIEARFREAGLEPPDAEEVLPVEGRDRAEQVVDLLLSEGRLVRIRDGRLFHGGALEALRTKLQEYAKKSKTIDVGTFKQLAGVTRKNAIPLLEQLDSERRTRRVGNVREILNA